MLKQSWSRWKELNRHRSIINRVLWPLSYTARLVDPTGLKPAPHGLKGRRSVTRAPGQQEWLWRKDSNLRMAALTVRCLTNLATPQENWLREQESNLPMLAYETSEPPLLYSRVKLGCGDESRTRIISFTRRAL